MFVLEFIKEKVSDCLHQGSESSCSRKRSSASSFEVRSSAGFRARKHLLNHVDQKVYQALQIALGQTCAICPRVRVTDIVWLVDAAHQMNDVVSIDRKCVSFLLCRLSDMKPRFVIQMMDGDSSMARQSNPVDRAIRAAGIRIIHLNPDGLTVEHLVSRLRSAIDETPSRTDPRIA
jgi:hypothetical protein